MKQPPCFENENSTMVCKLNKVLYGLKRSLMVWYDKLHQVLFHFGFSSNKYDHSLFTYKHQGIKLYDIAYDDDIFIIGNLFDLITKLHDKFTLKKLGKSEYFLGIEVKYQPNYFEEIGKF